MLARAQRALADFFRLEAAGGIVLIGAALLALASRRGLIDALGPFPVAAVALLIGMIGVMIVFTDLMVRGLYAQVGAAKDAPPVEEKRSDDEE